MMRNRIMVMALCAAALALAGPAAAESNAPVRVGVFPQEVARAYPLEGGADAVALTEGAVLVRSGGAVRALEGGAFKDSAAAWTRRGLAPEGAAFTLVPLANDSQGIEEARSWAPDGPEPAVVGAASGLYLRNADGLYEKTAVDDGQGRLWAASDVRGVAVDSAGRVWFATLAGAGCRTENGWVFYTGAEGLPYNDFTCMGAGGDGSVWFGTTKGAIRFKDGEWRYRQGRRWLPEDHVLGMAVDGDGHAWFATSKGLGWIGYQPMTLAEKAEFYEEELEQFIRRTEYGYVSEVGLRAPGDKSQIILTDSDNDGLWTSMYGAGECFAYAATKNPKAKDRAKRAFEALRFLQEVTQMSAIKPPKGYVARTILPGDGPDPNEGRIESDTRHRAERDSLWKIYEPRWPKTEDGKWYWKSDTSSDELDGHYFFYPAYYDLVADTEEEKARVREVVRSLTDHLLEHNFALLEHDGTVTRWSIYDPYSLNNDANWWPERGLKSLSMLSYLAVAEHMTGDAKYAEAAKDLVDRHGYRHNAMWFKVHFGQGSGNQSDDEMAFMCFYNLMKYSKDEQLKHEILYSFHSAWSVVQPEMNPFFNFCYAVFGQGATYTNPWGTHKIGPWDGWLEDSMSTLLDFPLDRVGWGHRNSHRIDIVRLARQQASEPYEPPRTDRGYRNNGKVLPVSERFFHHWNTDPWNLDYGGNGSSLGSGTVYLLPYYMGLYHGFIEKD